ISARTRRFAKARSSVTLGTFLVALLVALKSPSLGFGLIFCAVLVYLQPELPRVGSEDVGKVPSSSASPPQREPEIIVRWPMGLSWQQGPLSAGAIGRFLVPE